MTQSKLGLEVGINPTYINDIEAWRRYPCPSWRDKLCRYLRVPEHELFPKQADLLDMIKYLSEENERLQKELDKQRSLVVSQTSRTRDNSRFL